MSHPSPHPDRATLQSWLDFLLSPDEAEEVERHIEECEHCARELERLEESQAGFLDRVREMHDGVGAADGSAGAHSTERGHSDVELMDEDREVTLAWQDICGDESLADQTIKGSRIVDTVQPLNVSIKERSLRSTAQKNAEAGSQNDDYDLLEVIGKGGMGVVFSARQSSVDRLVAVKMLRDELASTPHKQQFLQEAVVTADLDHPNIVPVHELGSDRDGAVFYSMKQIRGEAWNDVIYDKSIDENLDILMRVADAVAFAHSRGIVHRDLKPENVMLGRFGEVWLMDWGLAYATDEYDKTGVSSGPQMGGTPAYMPPEMAKPNGKVDRSSDVYLLGAILFQIVTGCAPHQGSSVMYCLLAAARNEIVPTREKGGLIDIAYKAMATERRDRFRSVTEFQAALRRWMSHSESLAIARSAQSLLGKARESGDYEDFIRAIFGFEQACTLFPENEDAASSLGDARYQYAEIAAGNGDFDLALSLLDASDEKHRTLLQRVELAKEDQRTHADRIKRQRTAFRFLLAATCVLLAAGILVATQLRSSALQLANTNEPAMHASMSLQSGLRRSLGSLRGWVALGDPDFKRDRKAAWKNEVWPAMNRLESLASRSKVDSDEQRLSELSLALDDLYEEQWWIEEVAQTPGNEPAKDLLLRDIEPIESTISMTLESLVSFEREADRTDDSAAVWPALTDLQLTFSKAHRRLINVVDKGDNVNGHRFRTNLLRAESLIEQISSSDFAFAEAQRDSFVWVVSEFAAYKKLALTAVAERESEQANVAQWRLRTQAIPTTQRAQQVLGEIVRSHREATVDNSQQINRISMLTISVGIALVIGIALASLLSIRRDRGRRRLAGSLLLVLFAVSGGAPSLRADEAGNRSAEPADVYVKVSLILRELDLIRLEMGKPKSRRELVLVNDAAPHEVYFQALTMFEKTDELCFEQIRRREAVPTRPQGKIQPSDVLVVVDLVTEMLAKLKSQLSISDESKATPRDPSKTPTDVIVAIAQANQQLNLLVERKFTPSNVYQQVTLAVSYGSTLLASFPEATRLPEEPDYEPRKTPADVFRKLLDCYQRIRRIASASDVKTIRLKVPEEVIQSATPSEVYDIASLLVSELAYLHSLRGDLKPPRRVFYPGRIYPSHVYQRAGMLETQIEQLEAFVRDQPDWLRREK